MNATRSKRDIKANWFSQLKAINNSVDSDCQCQCSRVSSHRDDLKPWMFPPTKLEDITREWAQFILSSPLPGNENPRSPNWTPNAPPTATDNFSQMVTTRVAVKLEQR